MTRKKWLIALIFVVAVASLAFGADKAAPKTTPAPKEAAESGFLGGRDLGLIVNLVDPFTLAEAGDGVQAGLGMKLWLGDRSALRGLLALDFQYDGAAVDLGFGVSAAYEHHLSTGKISPYVGGIVGTALGSGVRPVKGRRGPVAKGPSPPRTKRTPAMRTRPRCSIRMGTRRWASRFDRACSSVAPPST